MRASQNGFTLIELSIVLAILGLIAGGIMGGQTLVKTSQLRGVVVQATSYASATTQFVEQYGELPGDFSRAARVWAGAVSGNGNGIISELPGANAAGENFQAWKHLMSAGYISGSFTGTSGPASGADAVPGVNVPVGTLRNTVFWYTSWGMQDASSTDFFPGNYNNLLVYGGAKKNSWPWGKTMSGANAYDIDKKVDDGFPGQGAVRTRAQNWMDRDGMPCVTGGSNPQIAAYVRRAVDCSLLFMGDFGKKNRI